MYILNLEMKGLESWGIDRLALECGLAYSGQFGVGVIVVN